MSSYSLHISILFITLVRQAGWEGRGRPGQGRAEHRSSGQLQGKRAGHMGSWDGKDGQGRAGQMMRKMVRTDGKWAGQGNGWAGLQGRTIVG